jgi:hypothetical protein
LKILLLIPNLIRCSINFTYRENTGTMFNENEPILNYQIGYSALKKNHNDSVYPFEGLNPVRMNKQSGTRKQL